MYEINVWQSKLINVRENISELLKCYLKHFKRFYYFPLFQFNVLNQFVSKLIERLVIQVKYNFNYFLTFHN